MASLTNLSSGTFNSLFLVNDQNQVENIRDVFGAANTTVPSNPGPTDVLSIPGLLPLLAAKRDISSSYSAGETDTFLNQRRLISDSFSSGETTTLLNQRRLISDSYSQSQVYTKTESDNALALRRLISDSFSQSEINTLLSQRRLISDSYSQSQVYTKTETDTFLAAKRNSADSYQSTQIDTFLAGKRNVTDSYTKAQVDALVAGSGGSLTTHEQSWLDDARTSILVNSEGVQELTMGVDDFIRAKDASGNSLAVFCPMDANGKTVMLYGSDKMLFQNRSNVTAMELRNDLTSLFKNHMHLEAANPEIRIKGTSAADQPSILFSTPASGSPYKSIIRAYGKNDNRSQLAFLVDNSTDSGSANNNDAIMICDSLGVMLGNPTVGTTPGSSLAVRSGNIELSDFGSAALQSLKWSAFRPNGRHEIAKIVAQSTSSYGGNLILYYRAPNTNVATDASSIGIHIGESGRVGIGGRSSTYKLAVAGRFHASSATAYVKNFLIDDPRPDKVGHKLKHSCVESDSQGENLYKRQLSLVQGKNDIQLPDWFRYINEDVMVWANAYEHRGLAWGRVTENNLHIDCSKTGVYNILIIGSRGDAVAKDLWTGVEIPPTENTD